MSGDAIADHERWMQAALALGRRSMGRAAPNPSVAALVVQAGVVVGRGVTAPGGRPHGEPLALAQAGAAARGATLYVTLEPCSHVGRTPPCVDAIIAAGIGTVVFALRDPDPRVAGRGVQRLRDPGIIVVGPVCEAEAARDHRGHVLRVTAGRPTVTLKMAETADGFAAARQAAERLLITGPVANAWVHMQRSLHDAVLVGSGTATADDPQLTVRLPGVDRQPIRIVIDSDLRLSESAALFRTIADAPLILVAADDVDPVRVSRREAAGASILRAPRTPHGLDLGAVLRELGTRGVTRLFCEGGPHLASAFIRGGWADTVMLLSAPKRLDAEGVPSLDASAYRSVDNAMIYALRDDAALGADRLRLFERIETPCSPD